MRWGGSPATACHWETDARTAGRSGVKGCYVATGEARRYEFEKLSRSHRNPGGRLALTKIAKLSSPEQGGAGDRGHATSVIHPARQLFPGQTGSFVSWRIHHAWFVWFKLKTAVMFSLHQVARVASSAYAWWSGVRLSIGGITDVAAAIH